MDAPFDVPVPRIPLLYGRLPCLEIGPFPTLRPTTTNIALAEMHAEMGVVLFRIEIALAKLNNYGYNIPALPFFCNDLQQINYFLPSTTSSGSMPNCSAAWHAAVSVQNMPCGAPKPRNAVFEARLVRHKCPYTSRLPNLYVLSMCAIARS